MSDTCANASRRDRAAAVIADYDAAATPGARPGRTRDRGSAAEAISELLCDLRHLAEALGLEWTKLDARAERFCVEESPRHVVELTTEGFGVLDTRTEALRADVWSTREQAQAACEELNGSAEAASAR